MRECILKMFAGFSQTRLEEAKLALIEAGFDCWETVIGSRGVTKHLLTEL